MRYTERMRRVLIGAVVAGLLLGACSGDGGNEGTAAAGGEEPNAAPGAAANDVAVNGVLAALDGVIGDVQRMLVRDRRITPEATDRLQAVYTGPELLNQIDALKADVAAGLTRYRSTPGNRLTVVSRLIGATSECVFAEVRRDYSPISPGPAQPLAKLYVILVTKHSTDDPKGLNPTGWAMLYDGVQADGSEPENVCG